MRALKAGGDDGGVAVRGAAARLSIFGDALSVRWVIPSVFMICTLGLDPRSVSGHPFSMPQRETREALLNAYVDSWPLPETSIKWLNKRFDGTVADLVLSDAYLWRLALSRNPKVRSELDRFLAKNGLRLGMTNTELQTYASRGTFPVFTDQSNINAVGFSLRTLHPLVRAKIQTVGELRNLSENELLRLPGFGLSNLREVKRFLQGPDCSLALEKNSGE